MKSKLTTFHARSGTSNGCKKTRVLDMFHFSLLAYLTGLHKLSDRIFHLGPGEKCLNSRISGLDAGVASQATSMQGLHDMILCQRVRTNPDLTMKSDNAIL